MTTKRRIPLEEARSRSISLRVNEEMHAAIVADADEEDCSISYWGEGALIDKLRANGKLPTGFTRPAKRNRKAAP